MFINEKAWDIQQDNSYTIHEALKNFLDIYSALAKEYNITQIYVPSNEELYRLC